MWGGPAVHCSVNNQRRPVHSISASENACTKPTTQEPGATVAFKFRKSLCHQAISGESHDKDPQHRFYCLLMEACQHHDTRGNAQKGSGYEPGSAVEVDFFPVLYDDDCSNGDGYKNGKGSGNLDRNTECQQRNRNQRFPKTKGGSN